MAALAADVHIPHKGNIEDWKISLPATGADTFYAGALAFIDVSNNTGQIQVASLAAGDVLAGIVAKQTVTTAAADLVEIYVGGLWALAVGGVAATDVGAFAVADVDGTLTDNEADLVASVDITIAANDILVGPIIGQNQEETGRWWVRLTPGYIYSATLGWVQAI